MRRSVSGFAADRVRWPVRWWLAAGPAAGMTLDCVQYRISSSSPARRRVERRTCRMEKCERGVLGRRSTINDFRQ